MPSGILGSNPGPVSFHSGDRGLRSETGPWHPQGPQGLLTQMSPPVLEPLRDAFKEMAEDGTGVRGDLKAA
jgi:hypothetical protein